MKVVLLVFSVFFLSSILSTPAYCIDIFNRPSGEQTGNKKQIPPSPTGNTTGSKKKKDAPAEEQAEAQAEEPQEQTAPEETAEPPPVLDENTRVVQIHMQDMARVCPSNWDTQPCLSSLAESNKTLVSLYADNLDKSGFNKQLLPLKEHCAASTAASQIEVPAYAMKSAMTECANTIFDISESTKIKPFLSHYQLMITSIHCLDGDPRCKTLEDALLQIK